MSKKGFTLIELVIATVLTSILSFAMYSVFIRSKRSYEVGEVRAEAQKRGRLAMSKVVADLRETGLGLGEEGQGVLDAQKDEVTIVADLDNNGNTEVVRYFLSDTTALPETRNPHDRILYKSVNGKPGLPLGRGIVGLSFGYFDQNRFNLLDPVEERVIPEEDRNGNGKLDLFDIRLITILLEVGGRNPDSGEEYPRFVLASSAMMRNLNILARGGGSNSDNTLLLSASPPSIPAQNNAKSNLTATLLIDGVPTPGDNVDLSLLFGDGHVAPLSAQDQGDGTYTSTFFSHGVAGANAVLAVDAARNFSATVTIFSFEGADTLFVVAVPETVTANGEDICLLEATVLDFLGNGVPGLTVTIEITQNNTGATMIGSLVDNDDGTYTRQYRASTTHGSDEITGMTGALSNVINVITRPGPANILIVAVPDTLPADSISTSIVTATILDGYGDPLPDETVTIEITENNTGAVMMGTVMDNGDGTYTRTYKTSLRAGVDEVTAGVGLLNAAVSIMTYFSESLSDTGEVTRVRIADMGEDGNNDPDILASLNIGDVQFQIAILLNNGSDGLGGLEPFTVDSFLTTGRVIEMSVGNLDFAEPDVVAILNQNKLIEEVLNDQVGGLISPSYKYNLLENGRAGDVGDLDKDGDIDVLVGLSNLKFETWLNDGSAQLSKDTTYLLSNSPTSIMVGGLHIDGEGGLYQDAVIATEEMKIEIWFNDGNGGYTFSSSLQTQGDVSMVKIGDLNGDWFNDIVDVTENEIIEVWLNNGDGTFPPAPSYIFFTRDLPFSLAVGDMGEDGQGDLDVVVGTKREFEVWFNDGDGFLRRPGGTKYRVNGRATSIAIGDLLEDSEGDRDIVVGTVTKEGDGSVEVWINKGDGTFEKEELSIQF